WGASRANHGNWKSYGGLRFMIRALGGRPIRVVLVEKGTAGGDGETWIARISPNPNWSTIVVPFAAFAKQSEWQPPEADGNGVLNVDRVASIHFTSDAPENSDVFEVDEMYLVRGLGGLPLTPTQPTGPAEVSSGKAYAY